MQQNQRSSYENAAGTEIQNNWEYDIEKVPITIPIYWKKSPNAGCRKKLT